MDGTEAARIIELEKEVEDLRGKVKSLREQNRQLREQNGTLKKQVPVGLHTTAGNVATPESSIWNVMDRLGRRERFFNDPDAGAAPAGNSLKDKIKRFAAPSRTITVGE